jgi:ech hydrogenase subunit D
MTPDQSTESITLDTLLEKTKSMRDGGFRLVQVSAARLPTAVELIYSFDLTGVLKHLRLLLPLDQLVVPSICSIYAGVFLYENEIHDLFGVKVEGMAVDFHGGLYQTAVKFPLGSVSVPCAKPAVPVTPTAKPAATPKAPAPAPAPATA